MTTVYDQDEPTAECYIDGRISTPDVALRERSPRRRYPLISGILIGLLAASVLGGAILAIGKPAHPAVVKLRTTEQTTTPPRPTTPSTTAPPLGPPPTIQISPGVTEPNPLMITSPNVTYAPPNYTGAPQAGVGPQITVPGYDGLQGCALYVGSEQIGWQFPGSVNVGGTMKTYQCNPADTPASIPRHP